MAQHWKEILPVDSYIVRRNGLLQDYDRKVLSLLYQPLIGQACFGLYMTLWSELELDRLWGNENTHHHLMSMMQLNLKQIYNERKKLEGIGLLKTFVKEENSTRTFIYELQPPLTPQVFFNDGVLNIYLYNRLGKTSFNKVKHYFSDKCIPVNEYQEVTGSFNDVFRSLSPSELTSSNSEMINALEQTEGEEFADKVQSSGTFITQDVFDFSLFLSGISETLIPHKAFTTKVKEVIAKLAFVYNIDPIEMKNVVVQAMDEYDQIDIEELRKAARDHYQLFNGDTLPRLVETTQPLGAREMMNVKPTTQEEQLIRMLEEISPHQLLVEISGGVEPALNDLQIIENVMFNQKLPPGVVNVLIHYVMLKTDMKLSKNYVEKIASHWARKRLKTVKEAMDLAKDEHRQYQEWAQKKKETKETSQKNNQKFGSKSLNPEMKRRMLMLGETETQDTETKQESLQYSDEERQKRKKRMFDLLEGKEE